MQLLHLSAFSTTQFASLSILLKPNTVDNKDGGGGCIEMIDPLIIAAPFATVSKRHALESLRELHVYVTDTIKASLLLNRSENNIVATDFLKEDNEKLLLSSDNSLQIFRPIGSAGLGLHFRIIRGGSDNGFVMKLASLILSSNKNSSTLTKLDPSIELSGIVLCVGIAGTSYSQFSSSCQYTLCQRINDTLSFLDNNGINDPTSAKALLCNYLLIDDEIRKTNDMKSGPDLLILPEQNDSAGFRNLLSPMGMISPIADIGRKNRRSMMQSSRVLGGIGDSGGQPIDIGFQIMTDQRSVDVSRDLTERLRVLSIAENDSKLRKYTHSAAERKANLDVIGAGKFRMRRSRKGETREADFDNFDYKGQIKELHNNKSSVSAFKAIPALAPAPEGTSKLTLKSSRKDTTRKGVTANKRLGGHRFVDETSSQQMQSGASVNGNFDPFTDSNHSTFETKPSNRAHFDDEHSQLSGQHETTTVNIALNEDLTCAYRQSQITSCNVEGFIQASVKSRGRTASSPFILYIRDPAKQIETISENKKIAQDLSQTLRSEEETGARYKFHVNVPTVDTYFAVMKYKCAGDLRPVPIRVQTKVKAEGDICRVALQISSNPNNSASLTDLTIAMGVPEKVHGDSLVTQPPGGVWDDSKSSVIWCVSELGSGEKFQLQAKFEMTIPNTPSSELNFPVLVRCQCLFAQLSSVELEIREMTDSTAGDLTMKLARRYRLSHREKNS